MPQSRPDADVDEPTELDDYLFDLQGFIVLEDALSDDEVDALNDAADEVLPLEHDEWHGNVHQRGSMDEPTLEPIYEQEPFEQLIDHPSWIEYAKRYVGNQHDLDANHGPLYVDQAFFMSRSQGQGTNLHSGGHKRTKKTQFRYHDGDVNESPFHCGQINILVALSEFGPGDGATMAIPGSHKQNLIPPFRDEFDDETLEKVPGAKEVHMEAGDALLFVDSVMHGSATRTNPGDRRFAVFRYGPSWGVSRYGYEPSDDVLERLTDHQAALVKTFGTVEPRSPPDDD